MRLGFTLAATMLLASAGVAQTVEPASAPDDLTRYVDPFIGTGGNGHVFPGATMPFGMVQLSPSNDERGWKWSAGYHYDDQEIKGFAHTHLSGAGLTTLGDILLMPSRSANTFAGIKGKPGSGYRARFSHGGEEAHPGYYRVHLIDPDIDAELTATPRTGFHRYRYRGAGDRYVIIDPTHSILDFTTASGIEIVSDRVIRGFKKSISQSSGDRSVYFEVHFSQPFLRAGITEDDKPVAGRARDGRRIKAFVQFAPQADGAIEASVAISHVSAEGAAANFAAEAKGRDFDQVRVAARAAWQDRLSRILISDPSDEKKRIFYTALYRTGIAPNLISDVDGGYYAFGGAHRSAIPQFSNFSSWDTYRALHPLLTIIDMEASGKLIASMVSRHSELGHALPLWEALGHDNQVMIGYAIVSPIADAVLKGIPGIDPQAAYAAIRATALDTDTHSNVYDANGAESYGAYGFVSADVASSVSKTTEQNYADWTIAQVAAKLGKADDAARFAVRATGWRQLYDPASGDLLPRFADGRMAPITLDDWSGLNRHYVSGNIWAYSAYTPHDMPAAIRLHGGREAYGRWLEHIFTDTTPIGGEQHVDLSGFIGRYGHGDEPGHEMAYLFNFAGQPWRTQYYVNRVIREMYTAQPDGLVNNEDLGQMSAWYVFSTLGFYPVNPGDLIYQIGAPYYPSASVRLENGRRFTVEAKGISPANIYIQSATLNDMPFTNSFLTHDQIMAGGTLRFIMGPTPARQWGSAPAQTSLGAFDDHAPVTAPRDTSWRPYDPDAGAVVGRERAVMLRSDDAHAEIRYTLDGSVPGSNARRYSGPIMLHDDAKLRAIAIAPGRKPSIPFAKNYFASIMADLPAGFPQIAIAQKDIAFGKADGALLIDQRFGTDFYPDGRWTGRKGDLSATIDLGTPRRARGLILGFLNDPMNGIMPPTAVEIWSGDDPATLRRVGTRAIVWNGSLAKKARRVEVPLSPAKAARYYRVRIIAAGDMPPSISEPGNPPWLFVDELMLR